MHAFQFRAVLSSTAIDPCPSCRVSLFTGGYGQRVQGFVRLKPHIRGGANASGVRKPSFFQSLSGLLYWRMGNGK